MKTTITGLSSEVNAPERQEGAAPAATRVTPPAQKTDITERGEDQAPPASSSIHMNPLSKVSTHDEGEILSAGAPLPDVLKHSDLDRATETKRAALHVAEALATSQDDDQARRGSAILICADQIREDEYGALKPVTKCKHRACPICQQAKQRVYYARLQSALGYLPPMVDEAHKDIPLRQQAQALKLTLNMGQACLLGELKSRIQALHKLFTDFLKRAAIKHELLGYMRATEVTQALSEDKPRCNPHLHGFLLVRGDTDLSALSGYILKEWPPYILRYHTKRRRKVLTNKSAPSVKPLRAQTKEDLLGWASYILKGGTYDYANDPLKRVEFHSTDPEFWRGLDKALHRQTLISKGGDVAAAMDQAEVDYQAQLDAKHKSGAGLPIDHGSQVIKSTDFIFLRSVSGYARRSVLELVHRTQMSVNEYLRLPNVTGRRGCSDSELLNEVRSVVLGFSPASSFTLALIALNTDKSVLKQSLIRLSENINTRTSSHWSEPTEAPSKRPEDNPNWTPKINPPKPPTAGPVTERRKV